MQRIMASRCPLLDLSHYSKKKKLLKRSSEKQTATEVQRGEPALLWEGLGRREIHTGRAGSDPKAQHDFFPTGIAGKVQASKHSPMGKYPALVLPQTLSQLAGQDLPKLQGLTPSSPPNAPLGTAHRQPKSFQLTLSLPALNIS